MIIRWGRVFFVLLVLALIGDIVFLVLNPDSVSEMLDDFFGGFAGQAVLFILLLLGLPLGFLTFIVWLISRMVRWFHKE